MDLRSRKRFDVALDGSLAPVMQAHLGAVV